MSLDPPTYIVSLQSNIRARPISWEGAVRARTITDADLKRIKSIDKVRKEQRKQTVEADPQAYVELLLGGNGNQSIFQAAAKRQDIVQYMLVLTQDLVDDIPSFTDSLIKHPQPFSPFLPLLSSSNPEDQVPLLTASVLSSLLSQAQVSTSKTPDLSDALSKLYACLATLSKSTDAGLQDIAVQHYSTVLRSSTSRNLFWEQRKETLTPLVEILRKAVDSRPGSSASTLRSGADSGSIGGGVGLQLLYHVLLVIWQLSFEASSIGEDFSEEYDIIPLYTSLLRASPKEKTTRLLLSTLEHLLSTNSASLLPVANLAKLPQLLQTLKSRHLTDEDALQDLSTLNNLLDEYTKTQTNFDTYAAEVNSGHLRWSPPHRSAEFWRNNARKITEDSNGALVKKLAEIMGKAWENDKQVLAIGCNDVACLVREVPEKRPLLEKVGLKARVMELMAEADESVRWESLRATGEWLRYSFDG